MKKTIIALFLVMFFSLCGSLWAQQCQTDADCGDYYSCQGLNVMFHDSYCEAGECRETSTLKETCRGTWTQCSGDRVINMSDYCQAPGGGRAGFCRTRGRSESCGEDRYSCQGLNVMFHDSYCEAGECKVTTSLKETCRGTWTQCSGDRVVTMTDYCQAPGGGRAGFCRTRGRSSGCDDGILCNGTETCSEGQCISGPVHCNDGDVCNGEEYCDEIQDICVPGTSLDCDDGNECTIDCDPIEGCINEDIDCDDQNDCTIDSCDPSVGCLYEALEDGTSCDDDLFCSGIDTCKAGVCIRSGDPCESLQLVCNEAEDGCECLEDGECNDGLFCNGEEVCEIKSSELICQPGENPCPDDERFCNGIEECNEESDSCEGPDPCGFCRPWGCRCYEDKGCRPVSPECITNSDCIDGLYCNGMETCVMGRCTAANDRCQDDGLFCNGDEICDEVNDECVVTDNPCLPGLICDEENDSCVACFGDMDCDDELFCNGEETCEGGDCQPGSDPCTDDGEYCNGVESCDEENDECVITDIPCEDDQTCNELNDTCEVISLESIECSTNALGSGFFLLPGVVVIKGTETSFTMLDSQVIYDPPVVIPLSRLVNPATQTISQLVFVLPSVTLPTVPSYPTTVTVTVNGLSDTLEIGAFDF